MGPIQSGFAEEKKYLENFPKAFLWGYLDNSSILSLPQIKISY